MRDLTPGASPLCFSMSHAVFNSNGWDEKHVQVFGRLRVSRRRFLGMAATFAVVIGLPSLSDSGPKFQFAKASWSISRK